MEQPPAAQSGCPALSEPGWALLSQGNEPQLCCCSLCRGWALFFLSTQTKLQAHLGWAAPRCSLQQSQQQSRAASQGFILLHLADSPVSLQLHLLLAGPSSWSTLGKTRELHWCVPESSQQTCSPSLTFPCVNPLCCFSARARRFRPTELEVNLV